MCVFVGGGRRRAKKRGGRQGRETGEAGRGGRQGRQAGEAGRGGRQGLPVTFRQSIKMKGWLEEWVPSMSPVWGINCPLPRDQVFRYPREIVFGVSECSRKSIRQGVRSLGLHLRP